MLDLVAGDAADEGHRSAVGSTDREKMGRGDELTVLVTERFACRAIDDEHDSIMTAARRQ